MIKTKEKYDRVHKPLIPKSRDKKKKKLTIKETIKNYFKKPTPFIPDKDKQTKPMKGRFVKSTRHSPKR